MRRLIVIVPVVLAIGLLVAPQDRAQAVLGLWSSPATTVKFSGASTAVTRSGQSTSASYADVPGSQVKVVTSRANEKRRIALTLPTTYYGAPDRVMGAWQLSCRAMLGRGEPMTTKTIVTARNGQPVYARSMTQVRNLMVGESHTMTVRSLYEFTRAGSYLCNARWGARSSAAVKGDVIMQTAGRSGSFSVSAPISDPADARQCYWASFEYAGGRPADCASAEIGSQRVPKLVTPKTITAVRSVSATNRWMRAQGTLRVTTCAGLNAGVSPCRATELKGGYSTFVGRLVLTDANGRSYPSSCVETDAGSATRTLRVVNKVHHDQLELDLRFRVRPSCGSAVRVTQKVSVKSGVAGWVHPNDGTHLTLAVE